MLVKYVHHYIYHISPTQISKKVPIHLQNKLKRLLDILKQYEVILPVNKEQQIKGNTFINPVTFLAKGESLKIVLDAQYINSLINESKCSWPIESMQNLQNKQITLYHC